MNDAPTNNLDPLVIWRVLVSWEGGSSMVVVPARTAEAALDRTKRMHERTCGRALTFGVPEQIPFGLPAGQEGRAR